MNGFIWAQCLVCPSKRVLQLSSSITKDDDSTHVSDWPTITALMTVPCVPGACTDTDLEYMYVFGPGGGCFVDRSWTRVPCTGATFAVSAVLLVASPFLWSPLGCVGYWTKVDVPLGPKCA